MPTQTEYKPYGEEWKKEMMKLRKEVIIEMFRKAKLGLEVKVELPVSIELESGSIVLTANCPDEDDNIYIKIEDDSEGIEIDFNFTLEEAQKLGEFLVNHSVNARNQ